MEKRRFRRQPDEGWLGGVCAGLACHFGIEAWIIRLIWFLVAWFYGLGILAYVLLWIFVPEADGPSGEGGPSAGPVREKGEKGG